MNLKKNIFQEQNRSLLVLPFETVLRKTYKLLGCQPYGFKSDLNVLFEKPGESDNLVVEVPKEEVFERYEESDWN